jgi:hypothetical protein
VLKNAKIRTMTNLLLPAIAIVLLVNGISAQVTAPNFPAEALANFRGKERIDLFLEVDKNGKVTAVEAFGPWLTCGKDDGTAKALLRAAVEAARKSTFTPAQKEGKPEDGSTTLSYTVEGTKPEPQENVKNRITGGVVPGKSISRPIPKYSSATRKRGIQGRVEIIVLLGEDGRPIEARAISGHPLLLADAAKAACDSRYTPTLLAGRPVKVSAPLSYYFTP